MTRPARRPATLVALLLAAGAPAAAPAAAHAQIGNPVPQSVGLAGNYVALARGFGAVAWNPAGLGMPGSPGASLSFLPVSVTAGLDPITAADLAVYEGRLIPEGTKQRWLELIRREGGESGNVASDLTYLALNVGRVGLQASSSVRARVDLAPDVAELLLFGNAGLTGAPRAYDLGGSTFDIAGTTSFAASVALPLPLALGPLPDQHFSVGATLTYTIGNFLILGQEDNSTITSTPLAVDVRFPVIHSVLPGDSVDFDPARDLDNGRGFGVDLGAAWQGGIFSGGVVVRNVISTFAWDLEGLRYRAGTAAWSPDTAHTSFEERPVSEAPAALLERIHDLYEFSPVVAAGAAARVLPALTVTGELRHAVKDNLAAGARSHLGVGAEARFVPLLPLRAGLALISGGYQLSGGLGLRLGAVEIAASGALREGELGGDAVAALGLTFGLP